MNEDTLTYEQKLVYDILTKAIYRVFGGSVPDNLLIGIVKEIEEVYRSDKKMEDVVDG